MCDLEGGWAGFRYVDIWISIQLQKRFQERKKQINKNTLIFDLLTPLIPICHSVRNGQSLTYKSSRDVTRIIFYIQQQIYISNNRHTRLTLQRMISLAKQRWANSQPFEKPSEGLEPQCQQWDWKCREHQPKHIVVYWKGCLRRQHTVGLYVESEFEVSTIVDEEKRARGRVGRRPPHKPRSACPSSVILLFSLITEFSDGTQQPSANFERLETGKIL